MFHNLAVDIAFLLIKNKIVDIEQRDIYVYGLEVILHSLGISYAENNEFCFTYQNNGPLVKDEVYYNFNGKNNSDIFVAISRLYSPTGCIRYDTDSLNPTYIQIPNSPDTIEAYVYAHTEINSFSDYKFYDIFFDYNGNYYRISANNVLAKNLKALILEIVS